jgi:hypothetical protein
LQSSCVEVDISFHVGQGTAEQTVYEIHDQHCHRLIDGGALLVIGDCFSTVPRLGLFNRRD